MGIHQYRLRLFLQLHRHPFNQQVYVVNSIWNRIIVVHTIYEGQLYCISAFKQSQVFLCSNFGTAMTHNSNENFTCHSKVLVVPEFNMQCERSVAGTIIQRPCIDYHNKLSWCQWCLRHSLGKEFIESTCMHATEAVPRRPWEYWDSRVCLFSIPRCMNHEIIPRSGAAHHQLPV